MTTGDKRRTPRRSVTYPAYIDIGDGSPVRECFLCDASQEGALLSVTDTRHLPKEFILALSADGAARRRCEVAWRSEGQVGVRFIRDAKKSKPARPPAGSDIVEPPADQVDVDTLTP
jgi:hypothetical protein